MKQIANIHYEIADTPEMILAAKQLCHDVYLGHGYIDHPYTGKIIPNNSDETAVYFVALTDDREVVGTIRLNLGQSFDTLKAWGNKIYAGSRQRIEQVLHTHCFEIGALAVNKSFATQKISWGLYKAIYHYALCAHLDYGIISMDARALRSMEMLGWKVERIGEPMDYFGSLTIPGIMPVNQQLHAIALKNAPYYKYVA